MTTDAIKAAEEGPKQRFYLATIGSIPWKPGADPQAIGTNQNKKVGDLVQRPDVPLVMASIRQSVRTVSSCLRLS